MALRKNLTCGLIFVPVMVFVVLKIVTFGSSAPLQRSSDCQCVLSCEGELEHLKQLKSVYVHVELQSEKVHDGIYNVSGLLTEDGHCSVVVPKCLQVTQFALRIYADEKNPVPEQLYENTNAKPECTEKNLRSVADRNFSNKLLILMIFCCFVFVF